jgi:hypothetical protein
VVEEDASEEVLGGVGGWITGSAVPIPAINLVPSRRTGAGAEPGNWILSWTQFGRNE